MLMSLPCNVALLPNNEMQKFLVAAMNLSDLVIFIKIRRKMIVVSLAHCHFTPASVLYELRGQIMACA